jgi:hypothetical protein
VVGSGRRGRMSCELTKRQIRAREHILNVKCIKFAWKVEAGCLDILCYIKGIGIEKFDKVTGCCVT